MRKPYKAPDQRKSAALDIPKVVRTREPLRARVADRADAEDCTVAAWLRWAIRHALDTTAVGDFDRSLEG